MGNVLHFASQKERLAYLHGEYEEIKPIEAKTDVIMSKNDNLSADSAENPQKTASKRKKTSKKDKKDGEIQAE